MAIDQTVEAQLRAASALRDAERITEAIAAYKSALSRQPNLPDVWYNLGVLLVRARQFDAALAAYRQALDRGAARPEEIYVNRGSIFSFHLRDNLSAEKELKAALALHPDYVPALCNLGNIAEQSGDKDRALAFFERALDSEPHNYSALARYAAIQTPRTPDDPLIQKLKDAVIWPEATFADRAAAGFALGKALDDCGLFDDAFAAYQNANESSRKSAAPDFRPYDRKQSEQFFDELIAFFRPERIAVRAPQIAAPIIFICGMFRSGSTLAEQVLASHSRITAGGELDIIPNLARAKLARYPASIANFSEVQFKQWSLEYLAQIARLFPGADFVTDKRPDNFLYIGFIKLLFPNAKIINTMRSPLDTCLSINFTNLDHRVPYALDLLDTAHYYRQYRRLMSHWNKLFQNDILNLDYDVFVRETRPSVEKLLEFCGLKWEESCMSFHRSNNAVRTASVWQVRQPLYRGSSGRWRNYSKHLAPLQEYLADLLPASDAVESDDAVART